MSFGSEEPGHRKFHPVPLFWDPGEGGWLRQSYERSSQGHSSLVLAAAWTHLEAVGLQWPWKAKAAANS